MGMGSGFGRGKNIDENYQFGGQFATLGANVACNKILLF
jgi:hypothetical protein